jgi:hypothetical protein
MPTRQSKTILQVMHVLFWITGIGACIKAGALLFTFIMSLTWNPQAASDLYLGLNLSALQAQDPFHYVAIGCSLVGLLVCQALIFYFILLIFKRLDLANPFDQIIGQYIKKMSLLSLVVGVWSKLMVGVTKKLEASGIQLPGIDAHIGLGDAFLFFAAILFFISVLFARGIELQDENTLTI